VCVRARARVRVRSRVYDDVMRVRTFGGEGMYTRQFANNVQDTHSTYTHNTHHGTHTHTQRAQPTRLFANDEQDTHSTHTTHTQST
jgi:hypothetical protein